MYKIPHAMKPYQIHNDHINFITCTLVDWVDLFTRPVYAEIIIDSLKFCQKNKGLKVHAYVIMPSHLHLMVSSEEQKLSGIIRDFKQFTSKRIWKAIGLVPESRREWLSQLFKGAAQKNAKIKHAQIWLPGNHAKFCYSRPFTKQKLDYTHQNPVKARMVYQASHYVWFSAQDYAGSQGPLKVDCLMC